MYIAVLLIYSFLFLIITINMIAKQRFTYRFVCAIIIIALCILTFNYDPAPTDDLTRLNVWIQEIQDHTISEETMVNSRFDILWLERLYFQLISICRFKNALPIISIFIETVIIFGMYKIIRGDLLSPQRYLMIALLFFLSTCDLFNAISGVRFPLVCAPLFAIAYMDLVKKKNIVLCYIGYITLCFFHVGAVVILILRTVSLFCKSKRRRAVIYILLLSHYIILDILVKIVRILPLGNLTSVISIKITSMLWKMTTMAFPKRIIAKFPLAVSLIFMLYVFFKYYEQRYPRYRNYATFLGVVLCFSIGSLYYYDMFMRMTTFAYIAFVPIYWIIYAESKKMYINGRSDRYLCTQMALCFANMSLCVNLLYLLAVQYAHFAK